jgi:hypothetical protein
MKFLLIKLHKERFDFHFYLLRPKYYVKKHFQHCNFLCVQDQKDLHWHPQIRGMIMSIAADGFSMLMPGNIFQIGFLWIVWGCICLFPNFILVIFPAAIYQLIPH